MSDHHETPTQSTAGPQSEPLAHPVQFTRGMLGKAAQGTLAFDGKDRVTLTDADGVVVMDRSLAALGKVKRAEYGLYFYPDGKLVFVAFGNAKAYGAASLASNISAPALAAGSVVQHAQNKESGLEAWVTMLKEREVLTTNVGPASRQTYVIAGAVAAVLIIGAAAVALLAG
ncbi:hypothetical protein LGT39_03655 [Demequina sp. TTPB684]|uniref:hypothetical protein n=1 Tax=unclassified Demequina TaxID=2620311 RepID=UPI001CF5F2F9|nr:MULTISPECIES: hypothetical protein [unclassified Demequina]MCB2411943.1 hypothetical protein [Demequina sp. TTPB684]UPU87144.1 hypothetical protein LGT36_007590 [Demequina sp. TMPB413]